MTRPRRQATCSRALLRGFARGAYVFWLVCTGCVPEGDLGSWEPADAGDSAASDVDTAVDAARDAGAPACSETAADASTCTSEDASFVGQELTVSPGLPTTYFAHGASLPAGNYRLTYVDGCWRSGVVSWTVNLGEEGYTVVGGPSAERITMAPGTVGTFMTLGAYTTYEECVAANQGQSSVEFHFDGGVLGLQMDSLDSTLFFLVSGGETAGGRSPTFLLSCAGLCR